MALKWLKYVGIFIAVVIVVAVFGVAVTQKVSDGPMEFLQGGPFKTGELIERPITD